MIPPDSQTADAPRASRALPAYADAPGAAVHIAPSILNADFGQLRTQIEVVAAGADWIHLDVMDGHFVPNLSFGPHIVELVNEMTDVPLDVHLMIDNPDRFIQPFAEAGADSISVHCELDAALVRRSLDMIHAAGCGAGVVLNPDTPTDAAAPYLATVNLVLAMSVFPGFGGQTFIPDTIERVRRISDMRERAGARFAIEVDGGVDETNIPDLVAAGASMLVIGSRIFRSEDIGATVRTLRRLTRPA